MKIDKQSDKQSGDKPAATVASSSTKGNNQKHNSDLKQKSVNSKINSVMNKQCYCMGFLVVLLAVGYPIVLTIMSKTSKDDSLSKSSSSSSLPEAEQEYYRDCSDFFRENYRTDGVYEISPNFRTRFNVFCNMTAGGWTVIFRRDIKNDNVEFQLPIKSYKHGFGDVNGNHFLGLDYIHLLTKEKPRQLMVVLNDTAFKYNRFELTNEYYHYKMIVDDEIDRFIDGSSFLRLNNTRFSTIDVDFDLALNSNCSSAWKAGWWFTDCFDYSVCSTCMIMHGNQGVKNLVYSALLIK